MRRSTVVLITALTPLAWGTTYYVATEMLPADRPLIAATLRALPAGIALVAFTRVRPVGTWWLKAALLGTLNIGAFQALLFVSAFRLPGGVAATLGAVQPLVAAGLAAAMLNERLRGIIVLAGSLGVAGVALLVLRTDAALDAVGVLAGLGGTVSMALGVVLTKYWGRPVPLLAFTAWQLVAGGLVLVPIAAIFEEWPTTFTATNIAGLIWLATVGTALAYTLWFRGIDLLPVAQVSILGLLSPLVAALIGWAALDQTLSSGQLLGMALILTAVTIAQRQPAEPTTTTPRCSPSVVNA